MLSLVKRAHGLSCSMKVTGYRCINCQKEIGYIPIKYQCDCGGNLDVVYDYESIKKEFDKKKLNNDFSIWRYLPILPINDLKLIPKLHIGYTPVYKSDILAETIGVKNLFLKDESKNPSASFKDRASAVVLTYAREHKIKTIVAASTGNAGAALACVAASVQHDCVIIVPKTAPKAKIAQLMNFGAKVVAVDGTYDDAYELSKKATEKFGWYNRNTGYNPITREGKKTCGFEICEQFKWKPPDYIFVSVGDGNIISGLWKGFKDFYKLGFIDKLPKMVAVQSEKSNAVSKTIKKMLSKKLCSCDFPVSQSPIVIEPVKATTIADSISVDSPRDGVAAIRAVLESDGFCVEVTDDEIISAISLVARTTGVFGEPAGVTSVAGLKKVASKIKDSEKVVCVITGSGLKDINSAMKSVSEPPIIPPDVEYLKKSLKKIS